MLQNEATADLTTTDSTLLLPLRYCTIGKKLRKKKYVFHAHNNPFTSRCLPPLYIYVQPFNDPALLPGPRDRGVLVDEPGQLHALHPAMQQRKLHERPFNALLGTRNHNENVYDSTLENYCPAAWNTLRSHEPLLPVRRTGVP